MLLCGVMKAERIALSLLIPVKVLNEGDADALISLVRARAMGDFNVTESARAHSYY